ncbi:MAG TPA: inositol monophosphatase family protein [Candidatus Hydrogenedentes bacterium]|nr:inositol monophosphatase family protein [Candidatus Hydrogenedentota bacterium]HPA03094.1 inositol monophosphatase family protein [Candidatus Hydrogenedentota bacterium]HPV35955.1 inositol monophosphatase family protein [Candidatus Hydrogenedentota bacterium]HPX40675.1 inositol monophosphatase family protein [Candidatus Hydrogenedentota bacterium]HQE74770.1 inositol monophosphatase family protein [Candidatus Hydrogenedentota bacterium]
MAKTKAKPKTKASSRAKKAAPGTAKKQAKPAKAAVKPRPGTKDASKKAAKSTKKPPAAAPKANPKTKLKTTMKKTTQGPAKAAPKKAPEPKERQEAPAPATNAVSRGKNASLDREFLIKLAQAIREVVQPAIDASKGREVIGNAPSGDATFQLDRLAEKALLTFLRDAKLPVAYYSEDSGYTTFTSGQPEHLLVVDPIDGTRAAKSGFEWCVIAIGSTRVIERPRLGDIDNALVMELMGPRAFYAERGKGARVYVDGQYRKPKLSKNTDLETVVWSMTVPARPAELIFPTAAKLIDLTSLKGGFYACNSTSYSLTRLLTNQLDACVDIANRYYRDIPKTVQDQFINAGRGAILGIAPYDIAASLLIAEEAGCVVTDAYGKSLRDVLLLDSATGNHQSMVAAANAELHEKLLSFFDARILQWEQLLKRREERLNS